MKNMIAIALTIVFALFAAHALAEDSLHASIQPVVDSPEWDESVPIYGSTEVSVCNVCGADVTGNTAAHGKQHMLAGEGSGHHSEVRETVVGYETVHHDATGHWERAESGGHWE